MTNYPPSGPGFVTLLEAFRVSGGTAPGNIVGRLLADHHAGEAVSLAKLVHSGQVFGFEWRSSLWIPMFQFNAHDLSIAAAPQAVRAELPELGSGWAVAMWFALPNVQLGGRTPVDLLNTDLAAVIQAAQDGLPAQSPPFHHAPRTHQRAAHA